MKFDYLDDPRVSPALAQAYVRRDYYRIVYQQGAELGRRTTSWKATLAPGALPGSGGCTTAWRSKPFELPWAVANRGSPWCDPAVLQCILGPQAASRTALAPGGTQAMMVRFATRPAAASSSRSGRRGSCTSSGGSIVENVPSPALGIATRWVLPTVRMRRLAGSAVGSSPPSGEPGRALARR